MTDHIFYYLNQGGQDPMILDDVLDELPVIVIVLLLFDNINKLT
jgi:hypothetical protein